MGRVRLSVAIAGGVIGLWFDDGGSPASLPLAGLLAGLLSGAVGGWLAGWTRRGRPSDVETAPPEPLSQEILQRRRRLAFTAGTSVLAALGLAWLALARPGPEKFDAFVAKYAWLDPGLFVAHAAPAAVFVQFATQEDFLTPERAQQYFAKVSEPKQLGLYDAPHALNAEARRDRAAFLRKQLGLAAIDWTAIDKVPELVQPPPPKR